MIIWPSPHLTCHLWQADGSVNRPLIKEMRFADDQEHLNLALFRR